MCAALASAGGQLHRTELLGMKSGASMVQNGVIANAAVPGGSSGGHLQDSQQQHEQQQEQQQQEQQPPPPRGTAPCPGATWCRRAARAVRQRLQDGQQLFREYQYVVALDDTIRHTQADALRSDSSSRNRYANVLPYDYNRAAA
ncbi:hypothetical protein MNEG_7819 [Monoraphidium neglectum]|uniref:Uncharacterized protein n=1 Tax=Monoraphidium neglectum TaxID=145388 RepID=A0A0D2N1P6_9CHLO|nr:hypothetical protein MNEG_7819 [Monoraphidium neglectum]KIZ00146.1 hypothetical protein MNEG_7819 [Monoraphidium neglectum]|eukprot:XP_013899165.1 hypothetical protein MNEG_7819 [Monoraphidium neglectum]